MIKKKKKKATLILLATVGQKTWPVPEITILSYFKKNTSNLMDMDK